MKRKQEWIKSTVCVLLTVCTCLLIFSSCSSSSKVVVREPSTTEPETSATEPAPETQAQVETVTAEKTGVGFESPLIQRLEGVEVLSGRVERVGSGTVYSPGAGSAFFTINGTIAEDSEIEISIHPVSVLRYQLSLNAKTEKTVKAEIRVYKRSELLVSCQQDKMKLQEGVNSVDVCVDTGEGSPCDGIYSLRFYLDGKLVSENEYEA